MTTSRPERTAASLRGGLVIAVAIGVMNVSTYVSTLLAARLLGPKAYGGFAAVIGLVLIVGVVMLGLQTTGARRIAADPDRAGQVERVLIRITYRAAWVLGGACLLLTPAFDAALNLQSTATAAIVALIVWPMTVVGGVSGILQGERRWAQLAAIYLAMGLGRVVATLLLLWRPEEWVAALSMVVGFAVPAVIGRAALRRSSHLRADATGTADSEQHGGRSIVREVAANSHALMAFFALSNADVILSRLVLDAHASGLYAGGTILVKSLLFLPQFVIVVAFPSLSTVEARRTTLMQCVALVLGLGVVATTATWLLSGLALVFVGGADYAEVQDRLWLFAVLGTILSVIQLLIYGVVARQARRTVYAVWAALLLLGAAVSQVDDVVSLVLTVSAVDGALLVGLLAVSWWRLRHDEPSGSQVTEAGAPGTESVRGGVPAAAGADGDVELDGQVGR